MAYEYNNDSEEEHAFEDDFLATESTALLHNNSVQYELQEQNKGITWYFGVFLIVNAALGAGVLNFARAFHTAGGILVSSLIHLVIFNLSLKLSLYANL